MPQVLTTNAVITCPHGGIGTTIPSEPIWNVDGGLVLVENDAGTLTCVSSVPCKGYVLRSMGLNATRIRGKKVILVTDFNRTETGLPLVMSEVHPVKDNSSPPPLVDGQDAPPLPPPLADEVTPPVVTCSAPTALFHRLAPVAPPITTFTLTNDFPLQWILTLIKEPAPGEFIDLTTTTVPGIIVAPSGGASSGGAWNASLANIAMTLELAFLNSLIDGVYSFYMTGVSQRGLSENFVFVLTVAP